MASRVINHLITPSGSAVAHNVVQQILTQSRNCPFDCSHMAHLEELPGIQSATSPQLTCGSSPQAGPPSNPTFSSDIAVPSQPSPVLPRHDAAPPAPAAAAIPPPPAAPASIAHQRRSAAQVAPHRRCCCHLRPAARAGCLRCPPSGWGLHQGCPWHTSQQAEAEQTLSPHLHKATRWLSELIVSITRMTWESQHGGFWCGLAYSRAADVGATSPPLCTASAPAAASRLRAPTRSQRSRRQAFRIRLSGASRFRRVNSADA